MEVRGSVPTFNSRIGLTLSYNVLYKLGLTSFILEIGFISHISGGIATKVAILNGWYAQSNFPFTLLLWNLVSSADFEI